MVDFKVILIRLRIKLRPSVVVVPYCGTKTAEAKDRFNWLRRARKLGSSVRAPFFESRACSGIHPI